MADRRFFLKGTNGREGPSTSPPSKNVAGPADFHYFGAKLEKLDARSRYRSARIVPRKGSGPLLSPSYVP